MQNAKSKVELLEEGAPPESCALELDYQTMGLAQPSYWGDYEVRGLDNPPETPPSKINKDEIHDRDQIYPLIKGRGASLTRPFLHFILIALMVLVGISSYLLIQAVAERRLDQSVFLARQADLQKDAQAKVQRDFYFQKYRDFIIHAQTQSVNFQTNLVELEKVEGKRWLKKIFLASVFDNQLKKYMEGSDVTMMVRDNKTLFQLAQRLVDPPEGLTDLANQSKRMQALSNEITTKFTGQISADTLSEIKEQLIIYRQALSKAQEVANALN